MNTDEKTLKAPALSDTTDSDRASGDPSPHDTLPDDGTDTEPAGDGKNRIQPHTLYLVATPIGNLSDLSGRAVKVLSSVDFIAAEDTRHSGHLLTYLGIHKPMISYFEHNKKERGEEILARLEAGDSCALVTDAGTPAISDPGEDLVALCAAHGVTVTSVPGACAGITALTLSGLPTARFCFEGFLSANKGERRRHLAELADEKRTMIFHEAPHKLKATLADMAEAFGANRRMALCREMTKLNEEVLRLTAGEAVAYYEANEPRGEYVLVVEGRTGESTEAVFFRDMTIPDHVQYYMDRGLSRKDAIKAAARDRGVPKNDVYQEMIGNDRS